MSHPRRICGQIPPPHPGELEVFIIKYLDLAGVWKTYLTTNSTRATQIPRGAAEWYLSCPSGICAKSPEGNSNTPRRSRGVFELPEGDLAGQIARGRSQIPRGEMPRGQSQIPRGANRPRATQIPRGEAEWYLSCQRAICAEWDLRLPEGHFAEWDLGSPEGNLDRQIWHDMLRRRERYL